MFENASGGNFAETMWRMIGGCGGGDSQSMKIAKLYPTLSAGIIYLKTERIEIASWKIELFFSDAAFYS